MPNSGASSTNRDSRTRSANKSENVLALRARVSRFALYERNSYSAHPDPRVLLPLIRVVTVVAIVKFKKEKNSKI